MLLFGGAGLLVLAGAFTNDWGSSVVVRDDGDRTVARAALPESGRFRIEYMHSYYEVPATEHFVAEEDGSFELVEISSPSEAVLDYYELEGRKEAGDDLFRLAPEEHQRFEALPLIGTEKGERTFVVSDERVPLYEEDGPRHVTIRVEEDTPLTEARRMLTRSAG
jgi:hypothetical protein